MSHFLRAVGNCTIKEELGLNPINPLMQYVIDQSNTGREQKEWMHGLIGTETPIQCYAKISLAVALYRTDIYKSVICLVAGTHIIFSNMWNCGL